MSNVRLRRAGTMDAAPIRACVGAAYRRYADTRAHLATPAPLLADYRVVLEQAEVWVAETATGIGGVLVLRETGEGFLLDNIAVRPQLHGQGIGRALLAHAEQCALRAGHASIYLYTQAGMTDNIALYTHLGYQPFDRRQDGPYERVYLRKPLTG